MAAVTSSLLRSSITLRALSPFNPLKRPNSTRLFQSSFQLPVRQCARRAMSRVRATHDEEAAARTAATEANSGAPTIFDKIISKEIPSSIVYEDEKVLAFRDINPQAPVHVLVIPKLRDGLTELGKAEPRHEDILGHLLHASKIVAEKEGIVDGFRVVINSGATACQSVYHLHLHVLGGRQLKWPPATSVAIPKYALTGCNDTCGDVRIPYPFGIGANCSVNQWYTVECNSSTPYLPALNRLELLEVNLADQIVTVNTPKISDCQNSNQTNSIDLSNTPFLFSKSHNKFVYEGCGNAAMMDNGTVLTGCSTSCRNDTVSDTTNCFGKSCCQTTIPHYLNSYGLNLERSGDPNRSCGSAFLVDDNMYANRSSYNRSTAFVPTSLLWTLEEADINRMSCCDGASLKIFWIGRSVDLGNNTSIDIQKCSALNYAEGTPYLADGCEYTKECSRCRNSGGFCDEGAIFDVDGLVTQRNFTCGSSNPYPDDAGAEVIKSSKSSLGVILATSVAIPKYALTGCNDTCGNVRIPYPFGIGANCSVNQWYTVECNSSTPYLPALNRLELLDVNLADQIVTVNTPKISDCQNSNQTNSIDLGDTPFLFSKSHNKFVYEGCGNAAMMDNGTVLTGCSTSCRNDTVSDTTNCFGKSCCQTTIPHYLNSYSLNLERSGDPNGSCGPAFLVDDNMYANRSSYNRSTAFVPTSLLWTLEEGDINRMTCCDSALLTILWFSRSVDLGNNTSIDIQKCSALNYVEGTPYLVDGCEYTKECSRCSNSGGICDEGAVFDVDDLVTQRNFTCGSSNPYPDDAGAEVIKSSKSSLGVILATSIAIPTYSMTGCKDTCGNVMIPYPFGIGANCSVNQWYNVDCNSSTPYLPALNHLELLGVNLDDQIVTVNMPKISDCQNSSSQTNSIDLGNTPFMYSKSHNKFVFEGCGNAALMDNKSVLTGCSTNCRNDTLNDRTNCFGISCCQTTIPHYLTSYNINMEMSGDLDGQTCGSTFLVDDNQGSFNRSIGFVPTSLLWILEKGDFEQISCCNNLVDYKMVWEIRSVDLGNNTSIDIHKCSSTLTYIEGTPYLAYGCEYTDECSKCKNSGGYCDEDAVLDVDDIVTKRNFSCMVYTGVDIPGPPIRAIAATSVSIPKYALTGCNDTCGNVRIPFPFGIGADCSVNQWYTVDCNSSTPYLPAIYHLELLKVDLENQTVTVNIPKIFNCQNSSWTNNINLGNTPFLFSRSHNKFVFEGCGNAAMMYKWRVLTGCSSSCGNNTVTDRANCFGIGCCQTTIPHYLNSYNVNFQRSGDNPDGPCGSAFLVDDNSYTNRSSSNVSVDFVPTSLLWTLGEGDVERISCCESQWDTRNVDLGNNRSMEIQKCYVPIFVEGNPYLLDGCEVTEECSICMESGGSCVDDTVPDVDGLFSEPNFTCDKTLPGYYDQNRTSKSSLGVILAMEENRIMSIFDEKVVKEGPINVLLAVANLAMRCLNLNGKSRPTMKEVAMELETIRMSHVPSAIQTKFEHMIYEEDVSMLNYGESTSMFTSTFVNPDDTTTDQ
ncbi:hypothetical protein SSX86_019503 [Deinandra increscens subsp. villosa]|uniref:HIT domain-containing protein n=1 Tax=Deinandra increscens subsp. villosa TaxID=3103831 RepID=A0AAP0CXY0_9ASTR